MNLGELWGGRQCWAARSLPPRDLPDLSHSGPGCPLCSWRCQLVLLQRDLDESAVSLSAHSCPSTGKPSAMPSSLPGAKGSYSDQCQGPHPYCKAWAHCHSPQPGGRELLHDCPVPFGSSRPEVKQSSPGQLWENSEAMGLAGIQGFCFSFEV